MLSSQYRIDTLQQCRLLTLFTRMQYPFSSRFLYKTSRYHNRSFVCMVALCVCSHGQERQLPQRDVKKSQGVNFLELQAAAKQPEETPARQFTSTSLPAGSLSRTALPPVLLPIDEALSPLTKTDIKQEVVQSNEAPGESPTQVCFQSFPSPYHCLRPVSRMLSWSRSFLFLEETLTRSRQRVCDLKVML